MEEVKTCVIPVEPIYCERISKKCATCPCKDKCDYPWVHDIWDNAVAKEGENATLSPCIPIVLKSQIRKKHIISITSEKDFCMFYIPVLPGCKQTGYVVVSDIFVSEDARGQHLATRLLNYLMEKYDRDIFAKCVRDSSAEEFWKHVGEQLDANIDIPEEHSMYEQKPGKRDLGWYTIRNKNKKNSKEALF